MNTNQISPDDPRLTAFALDEMEPAERAEFARVLENDPAAQAEVADIRAAAAALGTAFRAETLPALSVDVSEILSGAGAAAASRPTERQRPKILRFPSLYFVFSGVAAACFAVFFVVYDARESARGDASGRKPAVVAEMQAKDAAVAVADNSGAAPAREASSADAAMLPLTPAESVVEDRFFPVADATTSMFPLRVGHESFEAVRSLLLRGGRPPRATVHVAELINAFHYNFPAVAPGEAFASVLEETEAPWAAGHRLVRIGVQAREGRGHPLATDARAEVEFNPARVLAWRLVGFERDGGLAGVRGTGGETLEPGDAVTVLYELIPVATVAPDADPNLLTLSLRYNEPGSGDPKLFERTLRAGPVHFAQASPDMKFATAVAAFGLRLRHSDMQRPVAWSEVESWARAEDLTKERADFVEMVRAAEKILQ